MSANPYEAPKARVEDVEAPEGYQPVEIFSTRGRRAAASTSGGPLAGATLLVDC